MSKKVVCGRGVLHYGRTLFTGPRAEVPQEMPHHRQLKHDEGLASSGRVRHERNDVTVIEIKNANLSPFRPTSETSQDRPLLAQSQFCVTSRVKAKKEKFDVIVEQILSCLPLEPSYSHVISPYLDLACLPV
jgi:hypothetical protein